MKYCVKCGTELSDDAAFCSKCGNAMGSGTTAKSEPFSPSTKASFRNVAKILMIVSTVLWSLCYLIPLAWCLPMTLSYIRRINNGEQVSLEFKICSLIFVSPIAGVFMLLDTEAQQL